MKDVPKAIEALWKNESAPLIATIARITHDIGIAKKLAQDALVTVLRPRAPVVRLEYVILNRRVPMDL